MNNIRLHDENWKPCRPGTILGVSDSKFRRQRRRFLVQSIMSSVVAAFGLFSAIFVVVHRRKPGTDLPSFGLVDANPVQHRSHARVALTCEDIERQMDNYLVAVRSKSDQLTLMQKGLLQDVELHIKICPDCRAKVKEAIANT